MTFFIGMWDYEEDRKKIERSKIKGAERKGFAGGLEQGIEEGKKSEKYSTALNMLNEKIDVDIVARCTNLSIEEIEKLQKELENSL